MMSSQVVWSCPGELAATKRSPISALLCSYSSIGTARLRSSTSRRRPSAASMPYTIARTSAATASPYANRAVDCIAPSASGAAVQPASVMTAMSGIPRITGKVATLRTPAKQEAV